MSTPMDILDDNKSIYTPIDCDFYDLFESAALKGTWVGIKFNETHRNHINCTKIITLTTKNKSEYATILDREVIRLDAISSVSPVDMTNSKLGFLLDKLDFNNWANDLITGILKDQEIPELAAKTYSHIINAMDIWINRMKGSQSAYGVWQSHDPDSWNSLLEDAFFQIVSILNKNQPDSLIAYRDTEGQPFQNTITDIIYHVINHSTYHRGQVITFMQQAHLKTVATDFIRYANHRKK